uniref:Helicase ATP-binding domain-containing protein n=1 Tax=viral metagenome TaxID=1070528 RepID=A0A6C0AE03_9ZZZZ
MNYVNLTGIRDGEFITSSEKAIQNKGTIIQIKGFYPPFEPFSRMFDEHILKDTFRKYNFFKDMDLKDIKHYLLNNSTVLDDLYLEDSNIQVKFIKISGKFFFENLTKEQIDELSSDKFFPIKYVYDMIPRKPGSKANKHTLIFRPTNWKLMNEKSLLSNFKGYVFNCDTKKISYGNFENVFVFDNLAITYPTGKTLETEKMALEILSENYNISFESINRIKEILKWFTPSVHKSLIQKIIRTKCKKISYENEKFNSFNVLAISFTILMFLPGSFVSTIQSYVTGIESATKRLAVSICEDSYLEDFSEITLLYACSLIAKSDRNWKPTIKLYEKWLDIIFIAQKDSRMYKYENHAEIIDPKEINQYAFSYFLLKELKSFQTDISMVLTTDGTIREFINIKSDLNIMPIQHCLDHHSLTEIVWYFNPAFIENFKNYLEVFNFIWNNNVGYNPRKHLESHFSEEVFEAQRKLWIARKSEEKIERNLIEKYKTLEFEFPESIIAGLVGPVEIKLNYKNILVVLKTDNVYDFVITRRPSRDNKDITLTDEEKEQGKILMLRKLKLGIKLNSNLKRFSGKILTLSENGEYLLDSFNDFLKIKTKFSIHDNMIFQGDIVNYSLKYTGIGIEKNAFENLENILNNLEDKILRRIIIYISNYKTAISLFQLGRDGKGTEYTVSIYDTHVFWFLTEICKIFPVALEMEKSKFIVKNFELWCFIKKIIINKTNKNIKSKFPIPVITKNLWKHQIDATQKLISPVKHGNLIWISVGLGKTLIVINYIKYLIENNLMCEYLVYTLPPAALDGVEKEFIEAGMKTNILDMKKSSKKIKIKKGCVNFIFHDHMRMNGMDEQLRKKSSKMLFIVDEFHKTLGKSQRTSLALEISKLSNKFVGLSGTIINNTNTNELIQWLEMIVDFEVTESNFWVAVGELVSSRIDTGIEIIREEKTFEMDEKYYKLVPEKLGGNLIGEFDFRYILNMCYERVNSEIIKISKKYIKSEPVFIVAKDITSQKQLESKFLEFLNKDEIFLISSNSFITYKPEDERNIKVIITTPTHSMGYTLTKIKIMISSVYLGNQTTREQLEGRINRIGQVSKNIRIITIHGGILSYIFKKYENARSISEVLKDFSENINV